MQKKFNFLRDIKENIYIIVSLNFINSIRYKDSIWVISNILFGKIPKKIVKKSNDFNIKFSFLLISDQFLIY